VSREHKRHLLTHLIEDGGWHQVLVFTRTKHGANKLARQLESNGIPTAAIHGNKTQSARVRALADFKANKVTALVATEVASRGLDIKELPHVVNYELPQVPEDYIHRIGRTARAGASGRAVSLVSPDEYSMLKDIEQLLKRQIPVSRVPEYRVSAPEPSEQHRHSGARHSQSRATGGAHSRSGNGGYPRSSSGTRRFGGQRRRGRH
jgi:ATP-dependent RNA helicase RhlE